MTNNVVFEKEITRQQQMYLRVIHLQKHIKYVVLKETSAIQLFD